MEVVASAVGTVLAEPSRIIFDFIHTRMKNFFKRRSNVSILKNEMTSLMGLRDVVRQKHDRMRDGDRSRVDDWLVRVDEFEKNVDEVVSTISATDEKNLLFSCFLCPILCKLSGQLVRKIESVKELKETGNSLEKMECVSLVEHIPAPSIIGQKTASENVDRLLYLLMDDGVIRIGVWGMGGVGKTTLVKNLNNELEKRGSTRDLGMIIWVTVSKETDVSRIQMQIAERLKMEVGMDRSEGGMAVQLHERLRNEERFLLILDDVWQAVDLDLVGIPRPEICAKGKIIITSRSLDVCREMETQADMRVKALDSKEAWELFCEHAGGVVLEERIRPIAQVVTNECDGLPLAICVVGASMRGKSMVPLWKDALRALQFSEPLVKGIEDKVYKTLKWSYDSLQGKHTKSCFLFCCLFPEDYNIKVPELVRYWYCEGLLDERLDYEELENRGIAVIQSLKDCCLLEPGEDSSFVKMHDVVRDVGIWIASSVEDECRSLVRPGIGLTSVSESEFMYGYKRVSFMRNQFRYLPEGMVQCPEASTLLLQENVELEKIPVSFLHGFGALKILDLSRSWIEYLPSLAQLNQLRALILSGCSRLSELPPLDGLSRLLVLDCSGTGIRKLPKSIEKLSSLRQLDIAGLQLQSIPYSAISKLLNLEVLRLPYVSSSVEGQRLFEVLLLLPKLVVLYAHIGSIPNLSSNNKNFNWPGSIRKSQILISNGRNARDWENSSNWHEHRVKLDGLSLSQESIRWLLCEATSCEFIGCQGITQMFKNSISAGSFTSLKELWISSCKVSLPANTRGCVDVGSFDLLPNLEEIHLYFVDELESISDFSKILGLRFLKLRVIDVRWCSNVNCLFFLEENQTLENVKIIGVEDCGALKRLFNYPNTRQHKDLDPILPNLERVELVYLPNLENLCRNQEYWENLQVLHVVGCHGIKKLPLNLRNTGSIKEIKAEMGWWEQLDWESEEIKKQLQRSFTDWRW